eukprot:SM000033S12348  [mRNA]  locus=s33:378407:381735:+ [translate_table: standard]
MATAAASAAAVPALGLRLQRGLLRRQRGERAAAHSRRARPAAMALDGDAQLREAARQTVDLFVKSGTAVGLGSGRASCMAIEYLGQKLRAGELRGVKGVPMSSLCATEAAKSGVPLTSLEACPQLAFAFDDADLVQEGTLYAIIGRKGVPGGEPMATRKAIARAAAQLVLIIDEGKFVERLSGSVPVLIKQDDWLDTAEEVDDCFLGDAEVWRRPSQGEAGPMGGDNPLVTEQGHYVLDLIFPGVIERPGKPFFARPNASDVASTLEKIPGIVGHGLYLDIAYGAALGSADGVKIRTSLFKQAFTSS